MKGTMSGSARLKTTRPTVVSMSVPLDVLDLGVRDVLVVVLRGQVHVLAGETDADRGVGRDVALLVARG